MRAMLYLCDAARQHQDGTISALRGGINRTRSADGTAVFRGSVVLLLRPGEKDVGEHDVNLVISSRDDASLEKRQIKGTIDVQNPTGSAIACFDLVTALTVGAWEFALDIDGERADSFVVSCELPPDAADEDAEGEEADNA